MALFWLDDLSSPYDLKVLLPCRVRCDRMALPPCDCPMLPWASWSVEASSCFLFEWRRPEGLCRSRAHSSARPSARGLLDIAVLLAPLSMRLRRGSGDISMLLPPLPTRPSSPDPLLASKPRAAFPAASAPPEGRVSRLVGADDLRLAKSPDRSLNVFLGTQAPRRRPKPSPPASSSPRLTHRERCTWLSHRSRFAASVRCPVRSTRACIEPDIVLVWRWLLESCARRLAERRGALLPFGA